MISKLRLIYEFLLENSSYNKKVRKIEYEKALLGCNTAEDKIRSLSVFVFNTQAFPKLDLLNSYIKSMKSIYTMNGFLQQLIENEPVLKVMEVCNTEGNPAKVSYDNLFKSLIHQKGWGDKTSALFSKIVYDIHANHSHLAFWEDAPQTIISSDTLYLPVDEVIKHLFNEIEPHTWDFGGINSEIQEWSGEEILLWDDLWFWGFITQKVTNKQRFTEYNEAKLNTLQGIGLTEYDEIAKKANKFIEILKSK
jgi:hypothetical protein